MNIKKIIIASVLLVIILSGYLWHIKQDDLRLKLVSFKHLPGWQSANTVKSLQAFSISCKHFLKLKPDEPVGSPYIPLKASDFYPACRAALSVDPTSPEQAKAFFEHWFKPVEFFNHQPVQGLFTGYYVPLLRGSLTKTNVYAVPLYKSPKNMITVNLALFDSKLTYRQVVGRQDGNTLVPYYTRKEINQGLISESADVLVWLKSPIDRLFLEIQGSGIVELTDGSRMVVGYADQNGLPYTAIGAVLIKQGLMTKDTVTMQSIRAYLEAHPEKMDAIIDQNQSFVFFDKLPQNAVFGVQLTPLTPGYSLAIDRRWIPIGIPLWLNTTHPEFNSTQHKPFQRLMIAQDTGGAIRGMVRGDVFWGAGDRATDIAGKMKSNGFYWLLIPDGRRTRKYMASQ